MVLLVRHVPAIPDDGCKVKQVRQRSTTGMMEGRRLLGETRVAHGEGSETRVARGEGSEKEGTTVPHLDEKARLQRRLARMYAKHINMESEWQPGTGRAEESEGEGRPMGADEEAARLKYRIRRADEETARLLGYDAPPDAGP